MNKLSRIAALIFILISTICMAQQNTTKSVILINNVNIFDGVHEKLNEGNVLIENNLISQISKSEIDVPKNATIIDGGGRVMIPGLIDAHWHTMFNFAPLSVLLNEDLGMLSIMAAKNAEETLLRGWTTVRDMGGNCFSVKKAIDGGLMVGHRIYPSGPMIGQTSGHSDFRSPLAVPSDPNAGLDPLQRMGHTLLADGVPQVLLRTRETLRMGATQIKAMAGGGVSSLYDPLDVTQYTLEEAKAVCDVAKTWNTYVAIHANTDAAIRMWIEAGVKSVEHGFFIEEGTAKLMAEKDVWWSMQAMQLEGELSLGFESAVSRLKYKVVVSALDKAISYTKKHKVKTAFGTDVLFDAELAKKQNKFLASLQKWYTPYEALKMATSGNAELLKLSGPRDPYPNKLGVIEEGAYADLILVDGNPLEKLELVGDPDKNFVLIMKDGMIYKNILVK